MKTIQKSVAEQSIMELAYVPALPTLEEVIKAYPMPAARLVLVAHILDTAVPYVRTLATAMRVEAVIAVPYSAQPSACAKLATELSLFVPDDLAQVGRLAAECATRVSQRTSDPVIIQEVGGYCADLTRELARIPSFRGIVEDTKQGQWRYEQHQPLPLPVFTIADSPLKGLEDSRVGRCIAYAIERLLRVHFFRLVSELRVAVLGYGKIGAALASSLRALGARVGVYDVDPIRMSKAVVDGHQAFERNVLLGWSDIVLGVSGHRSFTADDLEFVQDGVVLASGSSKQVEFDVAGIREQTELKREHGEIAELAYSGKTMFLLNDGRPINFLEQSILGDVLDLVYSELYLCTRELAWMTWQPGLHRLDRVLQQDLAHRWYCNYGLGR